MSEIVQQMTKAEAQECVARIRGNVTSMVELAIRLRDELGWKALGYASWNACVDGEFTRSRHYINRLIKATGVVKKLGVGPIGPSAKSPPESVVRPLLALPEADQKEAWEQAVESAGGKQPTAKKVKAAVEKAKTSEPNDGLTDTVREALGRAGEFKEIQSQIQAVRRAAKELDESFTGGVFQKQLDIDLKNAWVAVKFHMPFSDCPSCSQRGKGCKSCRGLGWLNRKVHSMLVPELKERCRIAGKDDSE